MKKFISKNNQKYRNFVYQIADPTNELYQISDEMELRQTVKMWYDEINKFNYFTFHGHAETRYNLLPLGEMSTAYRFYPERVASVKIIRADKLYLIVFYNITPAARFERKSTDTLHKEFNADPRRNRAVAKYAIKINPHSKRQKQTQSRLTRYNELGEVFNFFHRREEMTPHEIVDAAAEETRDADSIDKNYTVSAKDVTPADDEEDFFTWAERTADEDGFSQEYDEPAEEYIVVKKCEAQNDTVSGVANDALNEKIEKQAKDIKKLMQKVKELHTENVSLKKTISVVRAAIS